VAPREISAATPHPTEVIGLTARIEHGGDEAMLELLVDTISSRSNTRQSTFPG
jgi:hypothetical protein